jgi:DNA polymerase III subunit epsilon
MREIVLDTETTGLDPRKGHRVVEIGCVELLNRIPTGETFHRYLNPERDMPEEAFRVHGLSAAFLADKSVFASVAADFVKFVDGAKIVAHNAQFDLRFLNAELNRLGIGPIPPSRVTDTLALARRKFPRAANSLDALCLRYDIDTLERSKHGALLDAELLAEVYRELKGSRKSRDVGGGCAGRTKANSRQLTFAKVDSQPKVQKTGASASWVFVVSCVIIFLYIIMSWATKKAPLPLSELNEKPAVAYATINPSKLNMRACPNTECRSIATLTQGTKVKIIDPGKRWLAEN